jgi:glycosyltransferase involved in cell wall biosynthesis
MTDKSLQQSKSVYILVSNDLTSDQRMHRTATYLLSLGYDVTLVGRIHGKPTLSPQFPFKTIRIQTSLRKGIGMYTELAYKMSKLVINDKPDIIISVDLDTIIAGAIAKILNITEKLIWDSHELFTDVPELVHKPIKRFVWEIIGKLSVRWADACVTVNGSLAQILSKKYKKTFTSIWNAPFMEPKQQEETISCQKQYILYQGAVNKGRGLKQVIDSMPFIDEKLDLLIIGHGDEIDYIKTLAIQSSCKSRIKVLGFMDPNQLKSYTNRAYIGINLLEDNSKSYYYSLANKFFDYVHAGVPAVHMHFPEYVTLNKIHQVGLTIKTLSTQEISTSINLLCQNNDLYFKIKENCYKAASEWCWQEESKKWNQLLENPI